MSDGCSVREAEAGDLGVAAEVRELKRGNAHGQKERKPKGQRRTRFGKGGGRDASDGVKWKNRKGRI